MVKLLSLDMDWFNYAVRNNTTQSIYKEIDKFFLKLKHECVLPKTIDLVPEHQYLYPWALTFVKPHQKIHVVNIDQHHDFYSLRNVRNSRNQKVCVEDPLATVGCWNFFAFMVCHKLLHKYSWVTNTTTPRWEKAALFDELKQSDNDKLVSFVKKATVFNIRDVHSVLEKETFDGFIIVRSPGYTMRRRTVYHAVDQALSTHFPKTKVRRHKCRTNFRNEMAPVYAKALF